MAQQSPVYDPESDERGVPKTGQDVASGDTSDPTSSGGPVPKKRGLSISISKTTKKGGLSTSFTTKKPQASRGDLASAEKDAGGLYSPEQESGRRIRSLRKTITRKRAAVGGGILGGGIFVTVMTFSVTQGPGQFIHMSQLLQRSHLTSNEDFGDDRAGKYLFYAIAGNAENGRLGIGGNFVANRYEANLRKQGIQPVFDKRTGHLVGFATDNRNVAAAMQKDSGDRAKVTNIDNARDIKGSKKHPNLNKNWSFVDMRGSQCSTKCARAVTKNVMKSSHVLKINSSVAYRLLIKRGGIDMHPLNKIKKKARESDSEFIKRLLKRDAEETSKDNQKGGSTTETTDSETGETTEEPNTDVEEAVEEGNADLGDQSGMGSSTTDIFKKVLVRAGGGAALTAGVLCAAQDFGDGVGEYKYTNSLLPMMRMGSKAVSMGDQVKTGDDVSLDSLKPYNYRMHDKNAPRGEQSWTDAKSIQAEQGEPQTGPDLPEEAQLGNVNDKPAFFDVLNSIPGLSTVCSIQDTFENLPVVKQVSDLASIVTGAAAEKALAPFGTNPDELAARALATVAGNTVNPYAKGAEYGNLANVGAFVAGNENARTMGGAPLADEDVALLKAEVNENARIENSKKSIAKRYFDIYDADSFAGSVIDEVPAGSNNVASLVSNIGSAFSGSLYRTFGFISPKANAATSNFNYGMPKYGFSPSERDDPAFDDPYKNAVEIEESGKLDELNEKYGKNCFGMTITPDATVETGEQDAKSSVNPFKVIDDHPECDPKNNDDPWFKKYRFYLADASVNTSMTCYFGNADSCTKLGFQGTEQSSDSGGTEEASETVDMGTLYESSVNIACPEGTEDAGVQDGYTEGNKVRIRTCTISNAPSTASDSKNGKLVMNSRVSLVVYEMMKAARAAGINTTVSSGFRSMATQECLAAGGCGSNGTAATPGTSNHQMGIAMDTDGELNAWMRKNGEKFGFKWFGPGDDVHFSPTGR